MASHSCSGLAWLAAATVLLLLPAYYTASATDVVKREPAPEPVPLPAAGKPAVTANKQAVTAAGKSATKKPLTGKKIAGHKTTPAGTDGNKKKGKNGTKKRNDGKNGKKGKKKGKNGTKKAKEGKKNKKEKNAKKGKNKAKKGKKKAKKGKKKGKNGEKKNKDGKKKGKSGKNGKKLKFGQARANDSCVTDLISILAPLGTTYLAMNKQGIRIKAAAGAQDKKKQKSGDFQGSASVLQQALGGSMANLTCGSSKIDPNSSPEYKNLTLLNQCNQSVLALCSNSSYPATVDNCITITQQYINATLPVTKSNQSVDQICTAVSAFNKNLLGQMKNCTDIMTAADRDLANRRNNCTVAFANCRLAQRNSLPSVYNCKPGPGGAANKDDAKKQLEAASKVRDAAANLENNVNAALAAAGLANGPGADGILPAAAGRSHRQRRQSTTDGASCLEVLNGMASSNKSAASAAGSAATPMDTDSANSAATSMSAVANRPNLAKDLGTCAKDGTTTRLTITIAIVQIRVYMFWIRNWRITVIEIKITLLVITFPELPSPSTVSVKPVVTTPVGISTSPSITPLLSTKAPSPGIRRQRIFQLLNNHVKRS